MRQQEKQKAGSSRAAREISRQGNAAKSPGGRGVVEVMEDGDLEDLEVGGVGPRGGVGRAS